MSAREAIREHFDERQILQPAELHANFDIAPRIGEQELWESLRVFEEEYQIPVGQLRANDSLDIFTQPPETKNPFSWLFVRAATEDAVSELSFRLRRQRTRIGLDPSAVGKLETVRDYVIAWFGTR